MNVNGSGTEQRPTLGPGAGPAARLAMEDLEKRFDKLTSDTCAEVAWQFACSNLPDALGPLLERVRLQVDFAKLCIALAEALTEAKAAHTPAHCAVLLEIARTDKRLSSEEVLGLLHACSRYMAGQHVTDPLLWRKLLEAIPDDIAPDLRAGACARLAKAMEGAGVDDQASSNTLVRRAMPLSQASLEQFATMTGQLAGADVTCPRTWAAMQGHLRKCRFCNAESESALLQAIFSLPMRPPRLPTLIDAIGMARFLEGFERTFGTHEQHPAWGLLAEVVHECGHDDLWLTHMADMTKSGRVAVILLGELNRQSRPELLSAPAMCRGIFRLGMLALQRHGSFPKDFEELAAKVLGRLTDGGAVVLCLKQLGSPSLSLPESVLQELGQFLSAKIVAQAHHWSLSNLSVLDEMFAVPLCSLEAWAVVAECERKRNGAASLFNAVDTGSEEIRYIVLCELMHEPPEHLRSPGFLVGICSCQEKSTFGERCDEVVRNLLDLACVALIEHPKATIDIVEHERGGSVIRVLAKASAWPTLRNRVVDWASGENGPEPGHVQRLLIAMAPPSEH